MAWAVGRLQPQREPRIQSCTWKGASNEVVTESQMNIRILICGVVGGLIGTYALSLPLYLVLPTLYTNDWLVSAPEAVGYVGFALAVYIALCTGYASARWNWSANASASLRSGMLAGMLAALVAFPLIGAPAAAVASQGPIFLHGARPDVADRAGVLLVYECVVRAAWYPYLVFWGMLAGSALLSGLGGWFASNRGAKPWGDSPPTIVDEGCDTSVAIMVMASWFLIAVVRLIPDMQAKCELAVEHYGLNLRFSPRGITGWPVANLFILLVVSTSYTGRWCARRRNHPLPGIQRVAMLVQMLIGFLPLAIVLAVLHINRDILDDPVFACGLAAWILVLVYWAARGSRGTVDFSTADTVPPSFRDRLLLNAGFLGTVVPGLVMATGVTQAAALALGILAFLTPPDAPLVTPDASIHRIFAVHVWGTWTMVVGWILAATLHAAVVSRWQDDRKRRLQGVGK